MQEFARNIAKVSKESKLNLSEDEYVQSFKTGLMDVVYQWCKGAKFSEICKVSRTSFNQSALPALFFEGRGGKW